MARRGVLVVGMHRSGTSAVTRAVNLLGVPIGDPDDLQGPNPTSNDKGHWESWRLTVFNEQMLRAVGGAWSAPPDLPHGWHRHAVVRRLGALGLRAFDAVYTTTTWVWKDPRVCLLLPFWRDNLRGGKVAVLVLRTPLDIAESLKARNGFPIRYSLALWERYLREALVGLAGMPVFVTMYDSLLADPAEWCAEAGGFLRGQGFEVSREPSAELRDFLEPALRHHDTGSAAIADPVVSPEQRDLAAALERAVGFHKSFRMRPTGAETATTETLIAAHRAAIKATGNPQLVPAAELA